MYKKRLLWHLYPSYLLITLVSLAAVAWFLSGWLKGYYMEQSLAYQKSATRLVMELMSPALAEGDFGELDAMSKRLGSETGMRITVILPDGRVVADTHEDPAGMENHADRPEVIAAFETGEGLAARKSPSLGREMTYFALSAGAGGKSHGVVRTTMFADRADAALGGLYRNVAMGGLAVLMLIAALGLIASRKVGRMLSELERGAERFAAGELTGRLPVPEYEEMARLTEAMNRMAEEMHDRIRTITRQRNEQEAILSSMSEGVMAVDTAGRILGMNQAAARLMGVDARAVKGRSVQEAARNTELTGFVSDTLEAGGPTVCELVLHGREEVVMYAHGTPLTGERGERLGAVVVLSDVTKLKRLERMRRDFVANVSHELRTPITSIMGFAELLSNGDIPEPEEARRYADIIMKQADRLSEIIDDLMSLSVIEKRAENAEIELSAAPLSVVVESAVQACRFKAEEKGIALKLSCGVEAVAMMNTQLMEQAVVNLVDNAIKYSEPERPVDILCGVEAERAFVSVKDRGCGIEEKHIPRLFERFYRVDKARSRKVGGTGLGLAIVKHIVQAHGGEVAVKSYPGEGSEFTIYLKKA